MGESFSRMSFAFFLAAVFVFHIGTNVGGSAQARPVPSQQREVETEEAKRLSVEIVTLINKGEYDQAMPKAFRVLEVQESVFGVDHPEVASSLTNIGYIFYKQNNYPKARECYTRALAIIEKHKIKSRDACRAKRANNWPGTRRLEPEQVWIGYR
jgi:tetratricopeptide (TPR) repeat protein